MVWTIDLDDFTGTFCGRGHYPLMHAMKRTLLDGEPGGGLPDTPHPDQGTPPATDKPSGMTSYCQLMTETSFIIHEGVLCCISSTTLFISPTKPHFEHTCQAIT